jgi:hypothetical protein
MKNYIESGLMKPRLVEKGLGLTFFSILVLIMGEQEAVAAA